MSIFFPVGELVSTARLLNLIISGDERRSI